MKRTKIGWWGVSIGALAMLGLSASCATSIKREPTVKSLIEANTKARGGAAALDAIRSIRVDAEIEEPSFKVVGRYYAREDGRMRIDIFAQCKRVFSEGLDDLGAWEWPGEDTAAKVAPEAGADALSHGVEFNLFGLHRYASRGHRIELVGKETIDGLNRYVLKITLKDGFVTYRHIDPATWQIVRSRDYRAYHPGLDPEKKWIETEYFDFRRADHVVEPYQTQTWDMVKQAVIGRSRTLRRIHNPDIPAALFSRSTDASPLCAPGAKSPSA